MKLYTFLNENDEILEEVRAETNDEALSLEKKLSFGCDFYSSDIEE